VELELVHFLNVREEDQKRIEVKCPILHDP
jgi:hypothetical protein